MVLSLTAEGFKVAGLPMPDKSELSVEMALTMNLHKYNEPVAIELPAGATEATGIATSLYY